MQKIIPHLWFDSQAEEAVALYTSLFEQSSVGDVVCYGKAGFEIHGQPEGKVMTVAFELAGQDFMALNGGPYFKFTPAISFLIACETKEEVDRLWKELSAGGQTLMELGEYPFSSHYGWTADRFGLSWQVMLMGDHPIRQKITPTLLFVGDQYGKAEDAMQFYTAIFHGTGISDIDRYGANEKPDQEGAVRHAQFTLKGQVFAAMDSAYQHQFSFNEAISLMIMCQTQEEIDYYWDKLNQGGDPKAQQCGWLKDQFGISWQVAPALLQEMLKSTDQAQVERVTNAFLQMKKFDLAKLKQVYEGKA